MPGGAATPGGGWNAPSGGTGLAPDAGDRPPGGKEKFGGMPGGGIPGGGKGRPAGGEPDAPGWPVALGANGGGKGSEPGAPGGGAPAAPGGGIGKLGGMLGGMPRPAGAVMSVVVLEAGGP